MHRGSDALAVSPKEARADKGIDAVMKAALPGVQEEEGRWRSQLRVEQQAQLRANAEVMRNVVLLHTANPSQAWGVAAGEAQRLKRAAEERMAERHGGAKSAGGAAAGLVAGTLSQEKQARLAQLSEEAPRGGGKGEGLMRGGKARTQSLVGGGGSRSHAAMDSFFDEMARVDEAKHAAHVAKYIAPFQKKVAAPRGASLKVAAVNVTILDGRRDAVEMKTVRGELRLLATRVDTLASEIARAEAPPPPPPTPPPTPPPATTTPPPRPEVRFVAAAPPVGCPLFPAQGEELPPDCPNQLVSLRAREAPSPALAIRDVPQMCADGSYRFQCGDIGGV